MKWVDFYKNLIELNTCDIMKYKICKKQKVELEISKLVIYVTEHPKKGPIHVPI